MPDNTTRTSIAVGDEAASQKSQLVESIYRIALEPHTYDVFMGRWDEFIHERLNALCVLRDETGVLETSEIATHFEIAERLLEQTRTVSKAQSWAPANNARSFGTGADPQFLINGSGAIVWSNAAAARVFGVKRTTHFDDLGLPDRSRLAIAERIVALGTVAEHGSPPIIFQLPAVVAFDGLAVGDVVHLQAQRMHEKLDGDLLLVGPLVAHWPPGMPSLLSTTYGLSQSECEICELLSRAHRPKDVAAYRANSDQIVAGENGL